MKDNSLVYSSGPRGYKLRTVLRLGLFLASISYSWPQQYGHHYTENGTLVDSTSIPIVNTCLSPMSIHIDQDSVTGGIAYDYVGGACAWVGDGENYQAYFYVPYHITCGNGVTYTGDTLFQEQDDFGQKGEVS